MNNKLATKGQPLVTQANTLIRTAYSMNTLEKRLLLVAMSKLNPLTQVGVDKPAPVDRITISADDWKSVFPDDSKPYQSLARACDALLSKQWRIDHEDGIYTKYNWLSQCGYNKRRGVVELRFTYDTSLRLHGLQGDFTTLQLHQIGKLSSFNQIRLYELLSQFRSTGYLTISMTELREALDQVGKNTRWADFKAQVLEPSVKAINKETNLLVTYKPVKEVRRIVGLEFSMRVDSQTEMDL